MRGLRNDEIENIIRYSLNKNPDLKYYIGNDYIEELINLLVEGVANAIVENNKKVIDDYKREALLKRRGIL